MMRFFQPVDPATYDASDPFGNIRPSGNPHLGSDWAVAEGTPVYAIADGYIVTAYFNTALGYMVGVQTSDGAIFYAEDHLSKLGPQPLGTFVRGGVDVLGWSGNTGSASKGPHLHVGMGPHYNAMFGQYPLYDPFAYIQAHLTDNRAGDTMYIKGKSNSAIYALYTDGLGVQRMRACLPFEASTAINAGVVLPPLDDGNLTALAKECGYVFGKPNPVTVTSPAETERIVKANAGGDPDLIAAKVAEKLEFPTAVQNGEAARAAIVK